QLDPAAVEHILAPPGDAQYAVVGEPADIAWIEPLGPGARIRMASRREPGERRLDPDKSLAPDRQRRTRRVDDLDLHLRQHEADRIGDAGDHFMERERDRAHLARTIHRDDVVAQVTLE